jgi:hypothetical protein
VIQLLLPEQSGNVLELPGEVPRLIAGAIRASPKLS